MYRAESNRLFRTGDQPMPPVTLATPRSLGNQIHVKQWRSRHGRNYDLAPDLSSLAAAAANAVSEAAERVCNRLPALPEFRRRLLRPLAAWLPGPYDETSEAINRVHAECLVAVATRCCEHVAETLDGDLSADEGDALRELLSHQWTRFGNLTTAEGSELDIEVRVALAAERCFPAANDDVRIRRISAAFSEATGRKVPPDSEFAALTALLAAEQTTEPRALAQNLMRLAIRRGERLRDLTDSTPA